MDIRRGENELVVYGDDILKQHLEIQINEKLNQLKQLDVRLDHIMTVEVKQIELKKNELRKEVESIQQELNRKIKTIEIKAEDIQ